MAADDTDPLPDAPDEDEGYPQFNMPVVGDKRRCVVCNLKYSEIDNIGRWRCRMHPGGVSDGRFACCGLPTAAPTARHHFEINRERVGKALGCVRCDHRVQHEPYTRESRILISEHHVATLHPLVESTTLVPLSAGGLAHSRLLHVSRFDVKAYDAAFDRALEVQVLGKKFT